MTLSSRYEVLENESSARLPVCILIDKSASMNVVTGGVPTGESFIGDGGQKFHYVTGGGKRRIEELEDGLHTFAKDIISDPRALACVELCIVAFGDTVEIIKQFSPIENSLTKLEISATDNDTKLGVGVKAAIDLLDHRKKDYLEYGTQYYQPQLVILTDGKATDPEECELIASEIQSRMNKGKLICLPFIVGDETDVNSLRLFAPKGNLFRIDSVNLASLFQYLSKSSISVSRSTAGGEEAVTLDKILEDLHANAVTVDQI